MLEVGSGTKFLSNSANLTLWTLLGSHKELGGASCGKEMVVESFDNLQLGVVRTNFFRFIIANLLSKGFPFQVWHNLKPFCYGCITWMHVHFSHIFELHHGLKVCGACPCRALDG